MTDQHIALLRLDWPSQPLFQNARSHWSKKAKAVKFARQQAFAVALQQGIKKITTDAPHVRVSFHPRKGRGRRPDPHNMPATCKAYIDGIADAMGCDDEKFQVDYASGWSDPVDGGCIIIEVRGPLAGPCSPCAITSLEG